MRKIKLTLTFSMDVREMLYDLSNSKGKSFSKMVAELYTLEYK